MVRFSLVFISFFSILFFGVINNSSGQSTTDLINKQLKLSPNLGIYVKNLTTGKVVSRYNSDKKLIPASNQKILTTLCFLDYLGANYRFDSYFFVNSSPKKPSEADVLNSSSQSVKNFYVDTKGDPSLTSRDLVKVVRFFKKEGLRSIEGDIILDNTYYEPPYFNKNWKDSWRGLAWAPHISSVSIDENLYKTKSSKDLLMTDNPLYLLGVKLKREFRKQNIKFKGRIILSEISIRSKLSFTKLTYKHSSRNLGKIVRVINKRSNNLYAEHLFKKLSANFYRTPGSWKESSKLMNNFLIRRVGIDGKSFSISDGSGLSRKNKITTRSMVLLLEYATNAKYFNTFYNSLPVAGIDGTLRKRFKSKPLYTNLKAKTGYINKVSSLSGFFNGRNGDLYAFSIIVNNYNYSVRPFIEKLLTKIYYF